MKDLVQKLSLTVSKLDRRHLQLFLALLTLSLLVIGAGAPGMDGGAGGG